MKQAIAPNSQNEERNNGVIGIGTDGQPVDMDLWEYTLMADGTYGLNDDQALLGKGTGRSAGYLGSYTEDGQIIGKVPQYISVDNGKTYKKVTSMVHTFYDCDNLVTSPIIPNTIEDLSLTFFQSSNLINSPIVIPNSVKKLNYTFSNCEKMNSVPALGNNIETMNASFRATAINEFSVSIPNKVISMSATFANCTNLQNFNSKLPNSVSNIANLFDGCIKLERITIEIPESVTNMQCTFARCSMLVSGPQKIPNSVSNMFQTFLSCPYLEGTIEINATINENIVYEANGNQYTGYNQSFSSSCMNGKGLVITGTCDKKNKWKNESNKITIN